MAAIYSKPEYLSKLRALGFKGEILGKYRNSYTELKFKCEHGHVFYRRPDKAIHTIRSTPKKSVCPVCNKNRADEEQRLTQAQYEEAIYPIIAVGEYRNAYTYLRHQCKHGHEFNTAPACLLQKATCPLCLTDEQRARYLEIKCKVHSVVGGIRLSNPVRTARSSISVSATHTCLKCQHTWKDVLPTDRTVRCIKCNNGLYGRKAVKIAGKWFYVRGFEPQCLQLMKSKGIDLREVYYDLDTELPTIPYADRKYIPDFFVPSRNLIIECKSVATFGLIYAYSNHGDRRKQQLRLLSNIKQKAKAAQDLGYRFKLVLYLDRKRRLALPKDWVHLSNRKLIREINALNGTQFFLHK